MIGGGNTAEFYHKEGNLAKCDRYANNGTLAKSQMQVKVHPDISRLVWKFGRWHHHVDYSVFRGMELKKKQNIVLKNEANNYGMELRVKEDQESN